MLFKVVSIFDRKINGAIVTPALQVRSYAILLLSSSSSSSPSSPLCRVFILIFLRQTISVGNTVLQLFCCYYSLVSVLNLLYFYISTFRSMCAVPNMTVFWSSLTSCVIIIIIILFSLLYNMDVSCHRPFLPGTSLEPAVIPTAQASSFTLQYFPYYVWCSKNSRLL